MEVPVCSTLGTAIVISLTLTLSLSFSLSWCLSYTRGKDSLFDSSMIDYHCHHHLRENGGPSDKCVHARTLDRLCDIDWGRERQRSAYNLIDRRPRHRVRSTLIVLIKLRQYCSFVSFFVLVKRG